MRSFSWNRFVRTAVAVALAVPVAASMAAAKPAPGVPGRPRTINLFASSGLLFETNRIACGLQNDGQTCVAFAGSPVGGGGFWPKGTPDQYIFNSGLQIGALIDPAAPFSWAGDTSGAYFFDGRGDQTSGEGLTGWYNSLDPADAAAWPNSAVIRNASTTVYDPNLVGQQTISQGDAWVRYWEGNPNLGPRSGPGLHPMGIAVDQRALAWNFPSGNEDIVYFIFTLYNVTARGSSGAYNNATIPAAVQGEIAAIGDQFQDVNEQKFKISIPDGGYNLTNVFAAFSMDADVAVFDQNYATAFLPFNLGAIYTGSFLPEVGWQFPSDIFGPPFASAPGFIGVKYLQSPESSPGNQVGLTMFSQVTNGAPHRDPVGVHQLYRYLSGYLGSSDDACSPYTDPAVARQRRVCYLATQQSDSRFFQASGPFTLAPGQATTIVVAYIQAAPVNAPGLVISPVKPGVVPGVPAGGDSLFADSAHYVRTIDRIAGWISAADTNGDASIEQYEINSVPRSLFAKAMIAQNVYDNHFLLPNAPKAPPFYLVPGDNQVTVVWQKTQSETDGDPYYVVASNPASGPLYDPDFRQFDVEGYRIYRGRTSSSVQLIAQFDYSGTSFVDNTGQIDYGDTNGDGKVECAPELGLTTDCPAFPAETDLQGDVVQIPPGKRVELASGGTINLAADTAVSGGGNGFPKLSNTGVPFAYVDRAVRNSFTYFYAVTSFDVNSVKSGPTSLESPRVTKSVTPRKTVSNISTAQLTFGVFGDDNVELDPSRSYTINANTGRFTGPPPPTGAAQLAAAFAPLVPQLLPALALTFQIDSVKPNSDVGCGGGVNTNGENICTDFYVTFTRGATKSSFKTNVYWPEWSAFGDGTISSAGLGAFPVTADDSSSKHLGVPIGFAKFNASVQASFNEQIRYSSQENAGGRRLLGSVSPGGSRWFDGADETVDHPGYGRRVGHVAGADTIFAPLSHIDLDPVTAGVQTDDNLWPAFTNGNGNTIRTNMQCFNYVVGAMGREADIEVTWGAGGTITKVRDVSDHVDVPHDVTVGGGYGFVGDNNGNGMIDWQDFDDLDGIAQNEDNIGFCIDHTGTTLGTLAANPIIMPVSSNGGAAGGNVASWASTGTGFGIYINGQRFIFALTGGNPPASGTKWTLRSYAGMVNATTNPGGLTPSGYTYAPVASSAAIPGLRLVFTVTSPTQATPETADVLANVHTVPDPYYVTDALEVTANSKVLKFVNLPPQAIIRIYSLSGVLVNVLTHDDPGLGAEATWNLRNRNNQFVASGVYFWQVETPAGHTKVGKFTIVNFAP